MANICLDRNAIYILYVKKKKKKTKKKKKKQTKKKTAFWRLKMHMYM